MSPGGRNGTISSIKEIIKKLNDADLDPDVGQYDFPAHLGQR
jgi:hypothetical protein